MLIFTCRFTQLVAVLSKMALSCITTRQIVSEPVDVPSSVTKAGLISWLCWLSLADASILKDWALGWGAGKYPYLGGTISNCKYSSPQLSPHDAAGVPGGGCIAGESTPTCTQLEEFLLSIPLSCLAIGLDIWTYTRTDRWFTLKLHSGVESNQHRINVE